MRDTQNTIQLNADQLHAMDALLGFIKPDDRRLLALLEGYAGTGKTTLVSELLRAIEDDFPPTTIHKRGKPQRQPSLAVAAPTNKAVGVLEEKIAEAGINVSYINFGSIHSLLGLQMTEQDDGSQKCLPKREPVLGHYSVVVVDECSMIDREMFERIVMVSSNWQTKVIFVGDPCQLPPVEEGGAARGNLSPVFDRVDFRLVLSTVVRQAQDNPIIALSMAIRQAIERNQPMRPDMIAQALPDTPNAPVAAGIVPGGRETLQAFSIDSLKDNLDVRIISYKNDRVQRFNQSIHDCLHGCTETPFVNGERVIVHERFDCAEDGSGQGCRDVLITSQEMIVTDARVANHPKYSDIPAALISLIDADESAEVVEDVSVYVPLSMTFFKQRVDGTFCEAFALKAKAERCPGGSGQRDDLFTQYKLKVGQAWGLRKAFCELRHTYAITSHKSQGSTFDVALVDYGDLTEMLRKEPGGEGFNRALYVACTRPSKYLAIVV